MYNLTESELECAFWVICLVYHRFVLLFVSMFVMLFHHSCHEFLHVMSLFWLFFIIQKWNRFECFSKKGSIMNSSKKKGQRNKLKHTRMKDNETMDHWQWRQWLAWRHWSVTCLASANQQRKVKEMSEWNTHKENTTNRGQMRGKCRRGKATNSQDEQNFQKKTKQKMREKDQEGSWGRKRKKKERGKGHEKRRPFHSVGYYKKTKGIQQWSQEKKGMRR